MFKAKQDQHAMWRGLTRRTVLPPSSEPQIPHDVRRISRRAALASVVVLPSGGLAAVCEGTQEQPDVQGVLQRAMMASTAMRGQIVRLLPDQEGVLPRQFVGLASGVFAGDVQHPFPDFYASLDVLSQISPNELPNYVLDAGRGVADLAIEYGLPLLPTESYAARAVPSPTTPAILPPRDSEREESVFVIVVDILCETVGIGVHSEIVRRAIDSSPEVQSAFNDLVEAISTQAWEDVADSIDRILPLVFARGFIDRLRTLLSSQFGDAMARRVLRRKMFSALLRLVPFVGWAYLAAAFVLSVQANWDRFSTVEG